MNDLSFQGKIDGKQNILIVDDDPDTCALLELLFHKKGYATTVTYSGVDALHWVESSQPDAVIMDVMMPEMDGWETFRRVRDRSDVPVLFLTALTSGDAASKALRLGVNDYVRKPFYPDELLARTQALLDNAQAKNTIVGLNEILVSVIMPAYNEELALPNVLDDLQKVVDHRYEVIVVDDGSNDGTANIAAQYPCKLIQHSKNSGKGAAMKTGARHARGQYVVFMDADGTYPASAIPRMVELLETHDLVRCERRNGNDSMPRINQLGNRLFDLFLSDLLGLKGSDQLSGLYGLRRSELLSMNLDSDGFDIESEINFKAQARGFNVATFPIHYHSRMGVKKLKPFRDGWIILSRILGMILVFNPVLLFILPGLTVMTLGIIGAAILADNNIITPYFGLDVHSFILATLGTLSGFQLVIFGMSAALYAVEAGYRPRTWLIWLSSVYMRMGMALLGSLLTLMGFADTMNLIANWLLTKAGPFTQTQELVLSATTTIGGLQILSASLFLSIFAGKLKKAHGDKAPIKLQSVVET